MILSRFKTPTKLLRRAGRPPLHLDRPTPCRKLCNAPDTFMIRTSSCILASVLLATSPRSEARPWSLTDIAPLLAGTDTIEVASTGAVLFNDHYADLKHDSIDQSWLILESNGAIRGIPSRPRAGQWHRSPDSAGLAP